MNYEFELANAEHGIYRTPTCSPVRRTKDAAIVTSIKHVGIRGIKREMVLIWMNRITAGSRRDVAPGPTCHSTRTLVDLNRSPVKNIRICWRHGEAPVIPRLIDVRLRIK